MICIKSFVIERAVDFITILSFMCYYMEQIAHWMKAMKNWEWNNGVYIFIVLSRFFQDYAIKAEIIWIYYHLSSEDQNKKNI